MDQVPAPLTRQSIIDGLANLGSVDIGLGHLVTLNASRHQATDAVWPTIIRDRHALPFQWEQLGAMCRKFGDGGANE
jgi:hypothetical protein